MTVYALIGEQNVYAYKMVRKQDTVKQAPDPDKALLSKFKMLIRKIGDVEGNYTLAGVINIVDHANPKERMDNVKFLFCKHGDEFYYRLGTIATINEKGVYIYIDYQTKRIIVSDEKSVTREAGLKAFGDLGMNIKSENYRLESKIRGNEQTISLINEHHISCKQYTISFDKRTMAIKRLYMRLSDFNEPLRTDNEKVVDVSIAEWDGNADLTKYPSKGDIVKNVNGGWKAVDAFKNYQIVKM
jgi:hypothetical protein